MLLSLFHAKTAHNIIVIGGGVLMAEVAGTLVAGVLEIV